MGEGGQVRGAVVEEEATEEVEEDLLDEREREREKEGREEVEEEGEVWQRAGTERLRSGRWRRRCERIVGVINCYCESNSCYRIDSPEVQVGRDD